MEPNILLSQLENQLRVLHEDKSRTTERMFQILGGIKVIEFLINECKATSSSDVTNGVNNNG